MKNYLNLLSILLFSWTPLLSQKAFTAHNFAQLKTREERLAFFHKDNLPNISKPAFDSILPIIEAQKDKYLLYYWYYYATFNYYAPPGKTIFGSKQNIQKMVQLSEEANLKIEGVFAKYIQETASTESAKLHYGSDIRYYEQMKHIGFDKFERIDIYSYISLMATNFYIIENTEKAMEILLYLEQKQIHTSPQVTRLRLNLIESIYAKRKDYTNALIYTKKIYEVSYEERLRTNSKDWYPVFWQGLSCLNQAEYLLEMGKYETCEALADSGYQYVLLSERMVDYPKNASEGIFNALQVLIKIKSHFKRWEEAKMLLEKASRIKAEYNIHILYDFNLQFYQNYVNYYEAQKEYAQAFQYQKLANEVKDSLNSQRDKRKLWQSEMQINTEKYQEHIQSAEKESRLQSQIRNLTIFTLVIFVVFAFIVYLRIKKSNSTISAQKDLLEQSLKDKEMLLKEVHHRVKNNLQIIAGLFERQAQQATDAVTRKNLKEGQDRVFSIALVHQNLYQSDNLSSLEVKAYLEMLVKNIKQAEYNQNQEIEVHLNIDDSKLNIDNAIPLGLILNELITNCYKYAFRGRAKGNIFIDFQKNKESFQLSVKDDGIGISKEVNLQKVSSLGLHLVRGLVRQIGANLKIESNDGGTCFFIASKT